jgi:FKBP-type peptidyl-prolyl cis-trans isomerase
MKKILLFSSFISLSCMICAQPGKTTGKPTPASPLKTLADSASYAIGLSVANFYKQQGITVVNSALIVKAINDGMSGKKLLLEQAACNQAITDYQKGFQEKKSSVRITEGKAFLEKNKVKPGVRTTPSGLQYEVITEGTGARPTIADSVTCNYRGTFIDGKGFDNSYDRGAPITFALTRVIAGWTEGLQLMTVGSKYKLYVPYTLGYGPSDYMSIPGGSTLIFEIELLDVKKRQ